MKQDQLVKHFHCKLDFIDFGHSDWSNVGATFRPKQILQQKEPVWPDLLHFLTHTPLELNL